MDQHELTRRIEVYLASDLPDVSDVHRIASALGPRLFPYVEQRVAPESATSAVAASLLPSDGVVYFTAAWDGNSQAYRPTVEGVGRQLARPVIEVDVDDPVGGAIAGSYRVANTPAVLDVAVGTIIIGVRGADELSALLSRS